MEPSTKWGIHLKTEQLWLAAFALVYFLLAKFGMSILALQPTNITLLWLPSGVGLIMCLKAGRKAVPWVLLASFFANLPGMLTDQSMASVVHTLISAMGDAIEPYVGSLLLKRFLPKGLQSAKDLIRFCFYVCLIPTTLSSLIITLNLAGGHYIDNSDILPLFLQLLAANSLGILLIYPLYVSWGATPIHLKNLTPKILLFFFTSFTLIYLAFTFQSGLIYLIPPLLALMAYHREERCLHILSLASVVFLMVMADQDFGPFDLPNANQAVSALAFFVFSMIVLPLSIQLHAKELQTTSDERDDWMIRASLDALTGLTNRYGFMPEIEKEYRRSLRYHHPFVFAMADIDHFKKINDKHGHLVGDEVLKQIAAILKNELRENDYICRFGGEEFALLLPETNMEHAYPVLERLRKTFENKVFHINGIKIHFTISLGATEYKGENIPLDGILDAGDKRLYKAKENGRNRLVYKD